MEGTVTVLGDRYGTVDIREKRRHIGLVSSALFERIPSRDTLFNVVLSGRFASLGIYDEVRSHDRDKAMDILSFLKCKNIAQRRYGVLSFGERQRALIGRALMADPALLILDEPCEGLDIQSREIVLSSLESIISSHGITLLMVSHRVEEILPAITHALILKNGEILAAGEKNTTITSVNMSRVMDITLEIMIRNNRLYSIIG